MAEEETIFGRIIKGEIPCDKVYEDDRSLVFRDLHPAAPVHLLVVPKKPLVSPLTASPDDAELLGHLLLVAAEVARQEGFADGGFRVVLNTGRAAGQEVMHLHLHLLAGRGFGWPPG